MRLMAGHIITNSTTENWIVGIHRGLYVGKKGTNSWLWGGGIVKILKLN